MTDYDLERMTNVLGGKPPSEKMIAKHDRWVGAWHRVMSGPLPVELLVVLADEEFEPEKPWVPTKGAEVMWSDNGMQRSGVFLSKGPKGRYYIKPAGEDEKELVRPDLVTPYDGNA